MKKIRITANPRSTKVYRLFPTVDDMRTTLSEVETDDVILTDEGFIEAEWMGMEYDDEGCRFDFIRLVKAREAQNSAGLVTTIHFGWLPEGAMPFRDMHDAEVRITKLDVGGDRIDMSSLFHDDIDDEPSDD